MKFMLLTLALLSFNTFASERLTAKEQLEAVEKIAKKERQKFWRSGHDDVYTVVTKPTKEELDQIIKDDQHSEERLEKEQIALIYRCFHTKQTCSVFTIDLNADYMGGSGTNRYFVLLNPETAESEIFEQLIYTE